jgi:hypothetical protein
MLRLVECAHLALQGFLLGAVLLALIKGIRYRHLTAYLPCDLVLDDYLLVLAFAALEGVLHALPTSGRIGAGLGLAAVVVLWLDALLFQRFSVELSRDNVRAYLPYLLQGHFKAETSQLLSSLRRGSLAAAPLWGVVLIPAGELLAGSRVLAALATAFGIHVVFALRESDLEDRQRPVLLAALLVLDLWLAASPAAPGAASAGALLAFLLPIGLLVLRRQAAKRLPSTSRLTLPSHLRSVAAASFPLLVEELQVRNEHRELLDHRPRLPRRSPRFGEVAGANVLVLTLESVGRDHLAIYHRTGAPTPFLHRLCERSVVSRHHFCISPHTNNAHYALLGSRYTSAGGFELFRAFARHGYQTAYVYPGSSQGFGLRQVLDRASFDHVLDDEQLAGAATEPRGDRVLATAGVDRLLELLDPDRPFFLQLMTEDTHAPYYLPGDPPDGLLEHERARYLRCLTASDGVWQELWDRLAAAGLLANTLVVITGDHGQAFGEMGYRYHSNAVIKEEIEVPFLLHHPRLGPGEVAFSSHLDVLPTVLDLLGIDHGVECYGEPIFCPDRKPALLLYSELRRNGVPSSQGLICGDAKFVVDLPFRRVWELDWNDDLRRDLAGDPYYPSLLHLLLDRAGLVTRLPR